MPIVRDSKIGFGQPILKGTRLTVYNIISGLYYSDTLTEYTSDFKISIHEIKNAIEYCKNTFCSHFEKVSDKYCDGCILRTISEESTFDINSFDELGLEDKICVSADGKFIFLGQKDELDSLEFGSIGWAMAEEVEKKFFSSKT